MSNLNYGQNKVCKRGHSYIAVAASNIGCPECHSTRSSRSPKQKYNPEKDRKSNLKRSYGMTIEQYDELFTKQNGSCAGCKRHQSVFAQRLAVDHCHITGEIRGLLCAPCNRALGLLKDRVDTLLSLIDYLKDSK
jgi:hypothetical protein